MLEWCAPSYILVPGIKYVQTRGYEAKIILRCVQHLVAVGYTINGTINGILWGTRVLTQAECFGRTRVCTRVSSEDTPYWRLLNIHLECCYHMCEGQAVPPGNYW